MRVLLIEDDFALATFLKRGLELEGHTVEHAEHGEEGIERILQRRPELVVLDLNLPKLDGIEVLRRVRTHSSGILVLVLTGRGAVSDRITCLNEGADDFLIKPFSFFELVARCRAILRRSALQQESPVVRCGLLEVDRLARTVRVQGAEIVLTSKEFALLDYLVQNRDRAIGRPELLEKVWRMAPDAGTNVVDVYVNYLRRKLRVDGTGEGLIRTVRGSGYTLAPASLPSLLPPKKGVQSARFAPALAQGAA